MIFLSTEEPEVIISLITQYPEFKSMYQHIYEICQNVEGVMNMFSKELQELDRNTVRYMIDEMQEDIDRKCQMLAEKDSIIEKQNNAITEKDNAITEKDNVITEKDNAITEKDNIITEKDNVIAEKERLYQEALKRIAELEHGEKR